MKLATGSATLSSLVRESGAGPTKASTAIVDVDPNGAAS